MGTKKTGQDGVRKITKVGGASFAVTLPLEVVKKLGWKEKQKVVVKKITGGVQIKDWNK